MTDLKEFFSSLTWTSWWFKKQTTFVPERCTVCQDSVDNNNDNHNNNYYNHNNNNNNLKFQEKSNPNIFINNEKNLIDSSSSSSSSSSFNNNNNNNSSTITTTTSTNNNNNNNNNNDNNNDNNNNNNNNNRIYAYMHSECPLNRRELGRASWAYLHTLANYYPDKPTQNEQEEMRQLLWLYIGKYPCGYCADMSIQEMFRNPPRVKNRKELAFWMCELHNEVNQRLGKPIFDCRKTEQRWRSGPPDGSCSTTTTTTTTTTKNSSSSSSSSPTTTSATKSI